MRYLCLALVLLGCSATQTAPFSTTKTKVELIAPSGDDELTHRVYELNTGFHIFDEVEHESSKLPHTRGLVIVLFPHSNTQTDRDSIKKFWTRREHNLRIAWIVKPEKDDPNSLFITRKFSKDYFQCGLMNNGMFLVKARGIFVCTDVLLRRSIIYAKHGTFDHPDTW